MTDIHLFRPHYRIDECLLEIRECLERGWTGLGFKTLEFERAWCAYTGLQHAHFTNSATAALQLALALLKQQRGWADGDEVITTPLTFVSTNHAILYNRLRPVFADVDEYLCLDPAIAERRITARTRAILFVGLGGNLGQLSWIVDLAQRHHLALIIDAAHMAGTRCDGTMDWATWADATAWSFHAVKNLPTADGGMLCFRDGALDALARQWSWLGIDKDTYARTVDGSAYRWQYDVPHVGYKAHGNSVMAALGLVGLKYLDQDNAYRRQLAMWYDCALCGVDHVHSSPSCESARHLYQILVENRDEVMLALHAQHIYPGVHYQDNTSYPMYQSAAGTCPNAARASQRLLSLPLHLQMTYADVVRISAAVNRTAKGYDGQAAA